MLRLVRVRRRPSALAIALILFGYAFLTGGRPPVMRSAWAAAAYCGGVLCQRPVLPANTFALAWLGRTALVAAGAAWLTLVLQRRVRDSTLARRPSDVAAAWLMVLLLIVAPLTLLLWPQPWTLRVAAVSPAVGFLLALPPKASLSLAALGSLPPWWVTPAVNAGAAALLGHRHAVPERERRSVAPPAPPSRVPARSPAAPGSLGRWVERFATGNDNPVLVQELRLGARRIGSRWQFSSASAAAVICLVALLPVLLLLYDTSVGDYAPGGVPLRDYLQVVTGIAGAIPLHLVPKGLEGFRLFFASVMALLVIGLSWPVLLGAPTQGAVTFSTASLPVSVPSATVFARPCSSSIAPGPELV